jgi:uncharacterized membrane protein YfcA
MFLFPFTVYGDSIFCCCRCLHLRDSTFPKVNFVYFHFGSPLSLLYLIPTALQTLSPHLALFQKRLQNVGKHFRVEQEIFFKQIQGPLTIVAGIFLGAVVTLTSIGAGAIGAVMLAYLYPLRLTPAMLVATDVVHAIPLAIFAGIGHLLIGNVDFALLAVLLLGSIPGVLIGTKISHLIPAQALRVALAAVLTAVALKLIFI